jgi:acetolactate synthase-1/2/3 large subunit
MKSYSRPVILLGNGARGCDLTEWLKLEVPFLTSWNAKDMVDNAHPWYFGSPGQYGQRIANKVMFEADMILAIGNRMSIWNVGYEGPRPDQQVAMVDVDAHEVAKFPQADHIAMTAEDWLARTGTAIMTSESWQRQCQEWRSQYPLVESPAHDDTHGYINSYRFMERLQGYLKHDQIIVTDMGAAHICAAQVLRLKPPQRFISSGGLGEMGCGLPMAIGASFARNKGEVLCFVGDGGIMMNLQELQTIIHHQLPIKIIVFNNGGYGMIRQTQQKAGMPLAAVNEQTGVSFPDFRRLALAFGFVASEIRTWDDFERIIPNMTGPCLIEYFMDPAQLFVPKLDAVYVDGKATSPRFCDMSPLL